MIDREFDVRAYDQGFRDGMASSAAEIEKLRAEVQVWINHTKTAVWSDSEECRLLTEENANLRAALEHYASADNWMYAGVGTFKKIPANYLSPPSAARASLIATGIAMLASGVVTASTRTPSAARSLALSSVRSLHSSLSDHTAVLV